MSTDTLEHVDTTTITENEEPGDHERFSHYVKKDAIMESAMTGNPVIALCKKIWTPGRDPQKFPVCPDCKDIYDNVVGTGKSGGGDKK